MSGIPIGLTSRRGPRGATEKQREKQLRGVGKLIRGQMPLDADFAIEKRSVQLLHELYQLLWILFAACCFGKYPPISNLGFHWFASVAHSFCLYLLACAMPRMLSALFCVEYPKPAGDGYSQSGNKYLPR